MATVSGPITGRGSRVPVWASAQNLDAIGYIEEEFFLEGDATLFSLAPGTEYTFDGRWSIESRGTVPFRTRILVRRPSDPEQFNGLVIVNLEQRLPWLRVSLEPWARRCRIRIPLVHVWHRESVCTVSRSATRRA